MANSLGIGESHAGNVCVVALSGRIDSTNAEQLMTRVPDGDAIHGTIERENVVDKIERVRSPWPGPAPLRCRQRQRTSDRAVRHIDRQLVADHAVRILIRRRRVAERRVVDVRV